MRKAKGYLHRECVVADVDAVAGLGLGADDVDAVAGVVEGSLPF